MHSKVFNIYDLSNEYVVNAYSGLIANILFTNEGNTYKSIAITSCNPLEGKTSTAINLAIYMAMSGTKVLLADTDFRKPLEAKRLGADEMTGLSDLLRAKASYDDVLNSTNVSNLSYISCGSKFSNPTGLLTTPIFRMFMKKVVEDFDIVLFDTPALSSVIDAALVASQTDGTIIVIEHGVTKKESLTRAKEQLEKANANILGVVINKVDKRVYKRHFQAFNYFGDLEKFKLKYIKNKGRKKNRDKVKDKGLNIRP
jgi:protein-tyrosine kinase